MKLLKAADGFQEITLRAPATAGIMGKFDIHAPGALERIVRLRSPVQPSPHLWAGFLKRTR